MLLCTCNVNWGEQVESFFFNSFVFMCEMWISECYPYNLAMQTKLSFFVSRSFHVDEFTFQN